MLEEGRGGLGISWWIARNIELLLACSRYRSLRAKPKEMAAFDRFHDLRRHFIFPRIIARLNLRQDIAPADGQQLGFVVADVLQVPVLDEMSIKIFQVWGYRKIFDLEQISRRKVQMRIDIEPRRILEKLTQATEQATLAFIVK